MAPVTRASAATRGKKRGQGNDSSPRPDRRQRVQGDSNLSAPENTDFSFGLFKSVFSNCTLIMRLSSRVGDDEGLILTNPDDKQELAVLLVNSLMLAAKSEYFMCLFSGEFQNSVEKRSWEIGIKPSQVDAFKKLLHFIYASKLPQDFEWTLHSYYEVAVVADYFQVRGCVATCAERLRTLIQEAEPTLALEFLDFKDKHIPELVGVASACASLWLSKCTPFLHSPKEPLLLGIPLQGLVVLARSSSLQVASEDVIAARIMDWIEVNAPAEKSLNPFVKVLWRHVRIRRLSPAAIRTVVTNTLKALDDSSLKRKKFDRYYNLCKKTLTFPVDLECDKEHAIQLATMCVTMLVEAGLTSSDEVANFTSAQRNRRRAGYQKATQT